MPLAKYITDFTALTPKAQITAIVNGDYNKDQLRALDKHVTHALVQDAIDQMLNHGELDLDQPDGLMQIYGGSTPEKTKSEPGSLLLPVASQINAEYAVFEELEKKATMSMLKIGLMMEYAKEQLPHGQFKKWAEKNLNITYRHAHSFRKLAQVFVKAQQIGQDEMLALVAPENSQAALGDKLRQMAFDFLGDKTQGELFEEHGIRFRDPAKRKYTPPKEDDGGMDASERARKLAELDWTEIVNKIARHDRDWMQLSDNSLETVDTILWPIACGIHDAAKGGM
jgi:hypothetical protein